MHLGLKQLGAFLAANRHQEHLVLATVIATRGSSYRKPGALVLLAPDGSHAGLISGGCLENDLVRRAAPVFRNGGSLLVSYDLHDDEELVFSLGLGCGGDVHLLLTRFDREQGFGCLPAMLEGQAGQLAQVTSAGAQLGEWAWLATDGLCLGSAGLLRLLREHTDAGPGQRTVTLDASIEGQPLSVLLLRVSPPPCVLVCGAGPDAVPLVAQVLALGWRCIVVDHRAGFATPTRFAVGAEVRKLRPPDLAQTIRLSEVEAAVVMSHHLEHDATYLAQLAPVGIPYLGLLGPSARRQTLLATIQQQQRMVHGPAGLDIGAELPEAIALSIVAEIHACLNGRDGRSLSNG